MFLSPDVSRFLSLLPSYGFHPGYTCRDKHCNQVFRSANARSHIRQNSPKPGILITQKAQILHNWSALSDQADPSYRKHSSFFILPFSLFFHLQLRPTLYDTSFSLFWWFACFQCLLCPSQTLPFQSSACKWKVLMYWGNRSWLAPPQASKRQWLSRLHNEPLLFGRQPRDR